MGVIADYEAHLNDRLSELSARALAAEHSVKVLTAQLEKERKWLDSLDVELKRQMLQFWSRQPLEAETIWDRDARAAMQGLLSWRGWECEANVIAEAGMYADALAILRKERTP